MLKNIKASISDSVFALYENKVGNYSMKTIFELDMVIERSKIEETVDEISELFPIFQ